MMKEVEEEEEKLLRTVFVGNLLSTVKKKQIIREFSQFGKVASARLRSVALVDVSSSLWDQVSWIFVPSSALSHHDFFLDRLFSGSAVF
jgi:RNA recognition motif-containing protein